MELVTDVKPELTAENIADEKEKMVTVYAVVDQRQDYLDIIRGL